MVYPDINNLQSYNEFTEVFINKKLIEENLHMKHYQILPIRYMCPENDNIKRFLIYHSPGTGKSFTALWITLNFINVYDKPTIILVKSKESIIEFKQRISSWYSYTFSYRKPLHGISNYQQFINKYIEFHTYITFCKSLENEDNLNLYDERLFIIDEIHHFRHTVGDKIIYNKLLKFLSNTRHIHVIFMSATPIFDNCNEIVSLVKLIKPEYDFNGTLTPEKLEGVMKGHLSYYGLNPPDTTLYFKGSSIPGINHYTISSVSMTGTQLKNYQKLTKESSNICNIGINHVKATLGVFQLKDSNNNNNTNFKPSRYVLKNDNIINSNSTIQNIIRQQATNIREYCCKLYYCLEKINSSDAPDGTIFIYCNIIDDVGIYYFSSLLCSMGYNYVYDTKSAMKYGNKTSSNDINEYSILKDLRKKRSDERWNFTFITGDKRLCPNMMERLNIFNNIENKNGASIKVLLGSDILSESVDIVNVRQLHIFTPHWNYEKINQIIGRIRRVGSHDALPPEERSVDIYLYMAYDPTIQCNNSISYSIDYVKYIISEKKYNEALKYNQALRNASIESLVTRNNIFINNYDKNSEISGADEFSRINNSIDVENPVEIQYSSLYIQKMLPIYLTIISNVISKAFIKSSFIDIKDLLEKLPELTLPMLKEVIKFIQTNNVVMGGYVMGYTCGLLYRKCQTIYHLHTIANNDTETSNDDNGTSKECKKEFNNELPNNLYQCNIHHMEYNIFQSSNVINKESDKLEISEEDINKLEKSLDTKLTISVYNLITKYSYMQMLEILKYALKNNLNNIKNLFYLYWKEIEEKVYISYLSTIVCTSYASNKNKSEEDFSNNIIFIDKSFKDWKILTGQNLSEISTAMQIHYDKQFNIKINHRYKYVYTLCNDFTLRYKDYRNYLNFNANKKTTNVNLRNVKRGRNIENFYDKKELLEMIIYSLCYDNNENLIRHQESNSENFHFKFNTLIDSYEQTNNRNILLIKHILYTVTENNVEKYCKDRPNQSYILYNILLNFERYLNITRTKLIDYWKEKLFEYNLIVIL